MKLRPVTYALLILVPTLNLLIFYVLKQPLWAWIVAVIVLICAAFTMKKTT
ncbi:hypothetical protein ERICIV_01386 [Paenibacillus larvae subsp. larvae]|uniref:Uncharacterized protein n=1 Tax=Paenibacillus larvae subsp. larvae TaxID=147375 RepID=A0A2L1TXZ6_9BACL|nr:hypothetical protein ERICIII_01365 [Paenibacillus larvae subsp. larvae]AVF30334.1 hypothetical protein ERICIV_01386 [Paenibacillus larvae subsp. larvae]